MPNMFTFNYCLKQFYIKMRSKPVCLPLTVIFILLVTSFTKEPASKTTIDQWFPCFDFDAAAFRNPPRSFGPFTRWWWPGNDVEREELEREVQLFADNGFAGVEIQPLTMGINPNAPEERLDKVYSWDTPSFYEHLKTVMEQARAAGITVDLNAGSGWPVGGPQLKPGQSMLSLTYSDTILEGGRSYSILIPKHLPDYSGITIFDTRLYKPVAPSYAKLQAVIAAGIEKKVEGQIYIDASTLIQFPKLAHNDSIHFSLPGKGHWAIIAYWSVPDGQIPTLIASRDPGFVVNHFDSLSITGIYNYLFGDRSGLQQYYGNPMRGLFNDSYEFRSDRHYCETFIDFFKKQRGYDITPWLGACLQKGYNNNAGFFLFPDAKAPFVFGDEDWRIQHDYDLTVGEMLQQQFIKTSDRWLNDKHMLHRTQAYGVKMDVIAASGAADIPEAEQLFAGGSEGFVKLITAGAHLYNKPVSTQESFVFLGRSEMTTPQKLKCLSDKAFTCGINQLIYSGSAYRYKNEDYGVEGWNTWSTPYSGFEFSSNENESFTYWNDIKKVNEYITRAQYVLRSGKPLTDVLIYFPFIDFTQEDLLENPEEAFTRGYFKGIEPADNEISKQNLSVKEKWFKNIWPVINQLNAAGITWEWVNDASLQTASNTKGSINIRNNDYHSLIIPEVPYMQAATARNIQQLAANAAKILFIGNPPQKQPGFLNYQENDSITNQSLRNALAQPNTTLVEESANLANWINTIQQPVQFYRSNSFLRTINRQMQDGSIAKFIWNHSGDWQQLSFSITQKFANIYWLDASSGNISKAKKTGSTFDITLPPYGSIILYASKINLDEKLLSVQQHTSRGAKELINLDTWDISSAGENLKNSPLFDWKNKEQFSHLSTDGIYTTSFIIQKTRNKKYLLDLGKVYFTASVKLNGKFIGKCLWSPYEQDITDALQNGTNSLEITVTPTRRNAFIYEAAKGNKLFNQFKGMEHNLMSAGLEGPVRIMAY